MAARGRTMCAQNGWADTQVRPYGAQRVEIFVGAALCGRPRADEDIGPYGQQRPGIAVGAAFGRPPFPRAPCRRAIETRKRNRNKFLTTSGSGRGKYPSFDLHPRAGWERQASLDDHRREIFRNRRFLNGVLVTLPLYPGPPREPSAAGRAGKGRAAE